VLSLPITHNKALESQFVLQEVVEKLRILAGIRVVDLVVRAHDGAYTSADRISEWPQVEFVHGNIVDIGRDSLVNVVSVTLGFWLLSKVFLIVILAMYFDNSRRCRNGGYLPVHFQ
jgi:hypothetical protein